MRESIHWLWLLQYVFLLPSRLDEQCPHFLFSACHKLAPVRYGTSLFRYCQRITALTLSLSHPLTTSRLLLTNGDVLLPFLLQTRSTLNDT